MTTHSASIETPIVPPPPAPERYTALVYFHGMGSQRRYEECSYLLQQLGNQIYKHREEYEKRVLFEPAHADSAMDDQPVAYHEVRRKAGTDGAASSSPVRFYEAYWAEYTAGGTNARSVLWWVLKQSFRPLDILRARWGEVRELRVGTLCSIYEQQQHVAWQSGKHLRQQYDTLVEELILAYDEFIKPESRYDKPRNEYRSTGFTDFAAFLQDWKRDPQDQQRLPDAHREELIELAWRWYATDLRAQWFSLAKTLALFILIVLVATLLLWFVGSTTAEVLGLFLKADGNGNSVFARDALQLNSWNILYVLSKCVAIWALVPWVGLRLHDFLQNYLGDVQQYVTYQETDVKYQRRTAILRDTTAMLRHVLLDPACERVIVVAHSLGTVIAYDALQELHTEMYVQAQDGSAASQAAVASLNKIQHFVTMGSPIDKVEFFFAAVQSKVPRYLDVVRAVRGDIDNLPFTRRRRHGLEPQIHWVNYWDQGDIISGPIRNVLGTNVSASRVDNVRVVSYMLPEPARCHGGYFDNQYVMEDIFAMTFNNTYSFARTHKGTQQHPEPPLPWIAKFYVCSKLLQHQQAQQAGPVAGVTVVRPRPDIRGERFFHPLQQLIQWLVVISMLLIQCGLVVYVALQLALPPLAGDALVAVSVWSAGVVLGVALLAWLGSNLLAPRFSVNPERTQGNRRHNPLLELLRHLIIALRGLFLRHRIPIQALDTADTQSNITRSHHPGMR